MASLWKHPNSKYWTACYSDKDGKQVKRSTKRTDRKKATTIASGLDRVERQARQFRGQAKTTAPAERFSDREREVLELVMHGPANKAIADKLHISIAG